jgi:ceramide glucosyltransferase
MSLFDVLLWIGFLPVVAGSIYSLLAAVITARFFRRPASGVPTFRPPVTLLKPVHGLEKNLRENLESACHLDYPEYQVIYSVQNPADPALPLLRELETRFGSDRVTVVVAQIEAGANGKVNTLLGAIRHARHEIWLISDSDTRLPPDYLDAIIAPLADPKVGCVCTPFRVSGAGRWFERMELLSLNVDFMPGVVFAYVTGIANSCLGPSVAFRRSTLDRIGGLESLADFLVEDYELGRRIWSGGQRMVLVPHLIDVTVDLPDWRRWWTHQVYWDQNTRLAQPAAFLATLLIRAVPFALLYAGLRAFDGTGLAVFGGALLIRWASAALVLGAGLRDREGLRSLLLLPFRDLAGLIVFFQSFSRRTVIWRNIEFTLHPGGKMTRLRVVSQ